MMFAIPFDETPSSSEHSVSPSRVRGRRSLWAGRLLCVAAGMTLFVLARRDGFATISIWPGGPDLAPAFAAAFLALSVTVVLLAVSLRLSGRKVFLVGLYALAFGGSLVVLSSATDMLTEDRLTNLRELAVGQQAIFDAPVEGS